MKIHQNYNLSKLNTFGVDVNAKFFTEVQNEEGLRELFSLPEFKQNKKIFLGGGSNVLFTKDFDGMVVLNKLSGVDIWNEDKDTVILRIMSGENWHALVEFAVGRGYWGIENLSLIPGTVGAAPMQNIGAYGRELKDVLENVEAYNIETGEKRIFSAEECRLGYRDSVFKNELKGKYFISAITLKLSKLEKKSINYAVLQDYLSKNNIEVTNPKDISDAVAEIRRSKLPDPKIIGNAGSFFKNVFVTPEEFKKLQAEYPEISYFEEEDQVKIPAGWLIEHSGWKGKRIGNVGVHDKQALVLVNYGGATGQDLIALAGEVIASVKEKFGLELVPEVNIV
jgi:UDP-N-acetylmuramate dehydrogenase